MCPPGRPATTIRPPDNQSPVWAAHHKQVFSRTSSAPKAQAVQVSAMSEPARPPPHSRPACFRSRLQNLDQSAPAKAVSFQSSLSTTHALAVRRGTPATIHPPHWRYRLLHARGDSFSNAAWSSGRILRPERFGWQNGIFPWAKRQFSGAGAFVPSKWNSRAAVAKRRAAAKFQEQP
jgi:hypothetical protein